MISAVPEHTQITCDRCASARKLQPAESMPEGWAKFSGPDHRVVDVCQNCIASFKAWIDLLKTK